MLQEASATSPLPHPQPTNMELITTSASKPASTTLPLPGAQKLQVHDADDAKTFDMLLTMFDAHYQRTEYLLLPAR
jgi:hypothetical protein